jgi:hypothetical protein
MVMGYPGDLAVNSGIPVPRVRGQQLGGYGDENNMT